MGNYREAAKHLKQTEFKLLCLSLGDGSTIWDTTVETEIPAFGIHPSNTYATESPATDGDSVFVFFPAAGSASCLDQSGQIRWTYQSGRHQDGNGFGSGSGLAYHDGMVFLQCDNDEDSYVVALEADSGSEVWKAKRQSRTSWSTPVIWKTGQREELVVGGSGHLTSYNPKTGSQNLPSRNRRLVQQLTSVRRSLSFLETVAPEALGHWAPSRREPVVTFNSRKAMPRPGWNGR